MLQAVQVEPAVVSADYMPQVEQELFVVVVLGEPVLQVLQVARLRASGELSEQLLQGQEAPAVSEPVPRELPVQVALEVLE
jgi:hypothetical protein